MSRVPASYPRRLSHRLVSLAPERASAEEYDGILREIDGLGPSDRSLLRLSLSEFSRNPGAQSLTLVAPLIVLIVALSGWAGSGLARDAVLAWAWAGMMLIVAAGALLAMVWAGGVSARRAGRADHWLTVIDGPGAGHAGRRRRR